MEQPRLTVITPTTGRPSLRNLVETIASQKMPVEHILLWDKTRDTSVNSISFEKAEEWKIDLKKIGYNLINIYIESSIININAPGSALRAIGLMTASSEWVTFADDDVMWESSHLSSIIESLKTENWAYCKRIIWSKADGGAYELIGKDDFESVGEDSKLEYKMVDNNCLIFKRIYGTSAAVLYRETDEYNDDRLMYSFLMKYAGPPAKTGLFTINQVCPQKLIEFFKNNCTKISL